MISTYIRERLLEIIRKEMIPEYKKSIECKENVKEVFLDFLENHYLTDKDRSLIEKYPYYVVTTDTIDICPYYWSNSKDASFLRVKNCNYHELTEPLKISLDKPIPKICNYLIDFKVDKEVWKIIGPSINKYRCTRNSFVEKYNVVLDFILHKNSTLALVKQEFPELYNHYKSCE